VTTDLPYELGELLGEGASARAFAATDAAGGDVVVKLLKPEVARDAVARSRFLREARAARGVSHARLVPVLAVGETGGLPWLALPRLRGGSLATALRRGALEPAATARLAEDLAGGLDALHRAGIVHRDVKPSNVLLDEDGIAHLADFGLAKGTGWTVLTQGGELLGTPHYVAPELISGSDASPASDIYALGCVLWEASTGAPPFAGRSLFEVGLAHLNEEPATPALPEDVVFALRAPLEKDPERRPATAHAVAALLRVAVLSSSRRA
jgi:eukaryotic-like serine/threonine-protein kinase